ncbi:MAG TPA: tetratricopeptide repeat protein [Flavobacteriales bacterium]|nr:tetratricopeptide repeat protein [Flavobacteriales bacterium]
MVFARAISYTCVRMRVFLFIVFCVWASCAFAGLSPVAKKKTIDSLKQVIKSAKHDSLRIQALISWDDIIYVNDPDLDLELNKKILGICTKNLKTKLNKKEHAFFLSAKAKCYNNLGLIYEDRGEFAKAIDCQMKGLKIEETIGDKKSIAMSLNNIGVIYQYMHNYTVALKFHQQSLKLREEIRDTVGISASYNNIGNNYIYIGDSARTKNPAFAKVQFSIAIGYYRQSLALKRKTNDKNGLALTLNNIGNIYLVQGEFKKAMDYYHQSLKVREEMGDHIGICSTLDNIGTVYYDQKNYARSIEYTEKALEIARKAKLAHEIKSAALNLYRCYKFTKNFKKALDMHELFIRTVDSLQSDENEKALIQQEYQYQYEKKAMADSLRHASAARAKDVELRKQKALSQQNESELKTKRILQYGLFGGLGIVLLFTVFMYNRFKLTQRQKIIIEQKERETHLQKIIIEEKQKEIIDSIHYAGRIQKALLPSEKYIRKNLNSQ